METSIKLDLITESLGFVSAELALSIGILILIILGLITKRSTVAHVFSIALSALTVLLLFLSPIQTTVNLFGGMLIQDSTNYTLRIIIAFAGLLTLLMVKPNSIPKHPFEFYTLMLTIILGGQMLVMSNHMVMLILSLELLSIPAYVLAGFAFTKESAEASMKYFIYGSVATAFMIFGLTWLYGFGKGLDLSSPAFIDQLGYNNNIVLMVACLFVTVGLLFKMAATPFHFWAPDVYQATPYPVLTLFSTVPKIAAGAVLFKMIGWFSLGGQSKYDWQAIASAFALLTLAAGNFSALWQKNAKRLMAYSSIAQAGFLLTAVAIQTPNGSKFFAFYASALVFGTVLVFLMLDHFQRQDQANEVSDFAGLGRKKPFPAILLTIGLISLTGLPITAGFTAKLFVFSGLLESWSESGKTVLIVLFSFGLLNTVVALYYYLQIPYFLFLKEPVGQSPATKMGLTEIVLGLLLAIILVSLFLWPGWL
jgi:NADH-quinone oxidoreductase subunit N